MLDKISQFFKFKPKNFLGVDIGDSSVRVVELSKRGQGYRLENYGEMKWKKETNEPLRSITKRSAFKLSNKDISENINKIIKAAEINIREACFSIPDFGTFFTNVDLPIMEEDEIEQAVRYQVRPYIPLSLNDVTLDWSIIEGEPNKTKLKVLVVAIPNTVIASYKEIAQATELDLRFLEPEIFPLVRSAIKNGEEKKTIALIDMGATSTTCSVLENKIVKVSHSFNLAGNELTSLIARSLNIDYNKAEELKIKEGLLPSSEVKNSKNIRNLLSPLVDAMIDEIKKAFRSFYLQEGREVQKIILSGGLSVMPGLKEVFAVEFKKPVSIIDPFAGIETHGALASILKEKGPYYGVAVGLALKGLE
ncbi:pilus assembly protein PilM [Patescibacteria group bacterium]|nr:pilus assembly protein PilM [Patescibacteria group bacterium]